MTLVDILAPVFVLVRQAAKPPEIIPARAAQTLPQDPAPPEAVRPLASPFDATPVAPVSVAAVAAPSSTVGASGHASAEAAAATLARQLETSITTARTQAHDAGFSEADFDAALFAVAAWADETLRAAHWPGARQWHKQLLQRRYFGISTAGVAFFTRLEALAPTEQEVREVYVLCLTLGFAGRYEYERNPNALRDIRNQALQRLFANRGIKNLASTTLFPDAYATLDAAPATPKTGRRWAWGMSSLTAGLVVLPIALLLALAAAYYMVLDQMADAIEPLIK